MQQGTHARRAIVVLLLAIGLLTLHARAQDAAPPKTGDVDAETPAAIADELMTGFYESYPDDTLERWHAALLEVREAEPNEPLWEAALIAVELRNGDSGAAKARAKSARERFKRSADVAYWYGEAQFRTLGRGTGVMDAMGAVDRALPAYRDAIKLDPGHVPARVGLSMYHLNAPWIAGGRKGKAKKLAGEMLALEGGEPWGRFILFQWAMSESKKQLDQHYRAAIEVCGEDQRRAMAFQYALHLIEDDPDDDRIPGLLSDIESASAAPDTMALYARARWHFAAERFAPAVDVLGQVLELDDAARNSRYMLAEALEKLKRRGQAAEQYRLFAEKFPEDDRAGKARKKAKRLSRG
ncbi:MAG: hypothetical protein AAGG07_09620 [Planctomycetota bacterium]